MLQIRIITFKQIRECPKMSFLPSHYRDDGTCKCNGAFKTFAQLVRQVFNDR